MSRLWELILKIFLHSPEMDRSVCFSMHLLWMTEKIDYFLRYLVFVGMVSFSVDPFWVQTVLLEFTWSAESANRSWVCQPVSTLLGVAAPSLGFEHWESGQVLMNRMSQLWQGCKKGYKSGNTNEDTATVASPLGHGPSASNRAMTIIHSITSDLPTTWISGISCTISRSCTENFPYCSVSCKVVERGDQRPCGYEPKHQSTVRGPWPG